jgi:hypothetical protein
VARFEWTEDCSAFAAPPDLLVVDGFALLIVDDVEFVDLKWL